MKHKPRRVLSWLLSLALALGLFPALGTTALADDNGTDIATYTIAIPATLTVQNEGWNELSDGIRVTGSLINNDDRTDKLIVTATSENDWKLKQQDGDETISYTMKASADGAKTTSWEFTTLSDTPDTRPLGIDVADYSNNAIGHYTDTVTFTAKLEKTFTVYFNANGHGTAPNSQRVVAGSKVSQPADPEADDLYEFGGWFMNQACTQQWDFGKNTVTGPMTLYAKWTEPQEQTLKIRIQYKWTKTYNEWDSEFDEISDEYFDEDHYAKNVPHTNECEYTVQYYPGETWQDVFDDRRVDGDSIDLEDSGIRLSVSDDDDGFLIFYLGYACSKTFPDDTVSSFVSENGKDVKIVAEFDEYGYFSSAEQVDNFD